MHNQVTLQPCDLEAKQSACQVLCALRDALVLPQLNGLSILDPKVKREAFSLKINTGFLGIFKPSPIQTLYNDVNAFLKECGTNNTHQSPSCHAEYRSQLCSIM